MPEELKPVYTTADRNAGAADNSLPGEYPYTRGIQPTMYRGRLWTMRQYAGMGDAEESNRRYRFLLAHGTSGLSVAFDLPTQTGYDSDSPMALGEVGRTGVAISSLEDMERLFAGIALDKVSTSMTINATASTLLAMYVAAARRAGADTRKLSGTVQNDILKEYIARGTYIYPVLPAMRLTTNLIAWAGEEIPEWNTISISGYHMREAGCTAAQEIAFTLANGRAYVDAALAAGLSIDSFAPRLSFFFNAHSNLFEEVAKFRAARRIWARWMREEYKAANPRSWTLRFHTQTAGSTLTAQQPENNIVRTTLEALAAVMGGTQSLHTNGFDEALALPTENAARIALRTQQILAHESGVPQVADPLGGSYYVEALTDQLEAEAQDYFARIDQLGGELRAVESGWVQQQIQQAAYVWQRKVDSGETVIVGVNKFASDRGGDEPEMPLQRLDEDLERRQVERLRALRTRRDHASWKQALQQLKDAAIDSGAEKTNLMPHIVQAVEALATVGEIADTLRAVFGEYRETITV
ncbi:acyl-CoA mutase large subunit family protein [Acidicapsa ligni]|uniref:acyl-CoA mutase large subunit family protein n=1 Tax=Acidicapsa ligni TaxID=542300 RepID=UPI0021DFA25C|nr:methylmalonyl-CoA mutase family protein [Acidicapsa ligni]